MLGLLNNSDRDHLLRIKLRANGQRRNREKFLYELTPELRSILSASNCKYSPEMDDIVQSVLTPLPWKFGCNPQSQTVGYSYFEFAYIEKMWNAVSTWQDKIDSEAFLLIRSTDYPLFVVNPRIIYPQLRQIWEYSNQFLVLVSTDHLHGIAFVTSIGFLENDFNSSEIVYEVITW